MSLAFKALLIVAVLAFTVSALHIETVTVGFGVYPVAHYNHDDLCASIGRITGCSGCTHGTKGLCSWIEFTRTNGVEFMCVPASKARENEVLGLSKPADFRCPADPTKEPRISEDIALHQAANQANIIAAKFPPVTAPVFFAPVSTFQSTALSGSIPLEASSTYFSKTFVTDLFHAANNSATITVDRTSLWGDLGFAKISGYGVPARHHLDCASIAQDDLFDIDLLSGDLGGGITTEHARYCMEHHLSAYYNFYCTPYGVAKSGICHSAFKRFIENCADQPSAFSAVSSAYTGTLTRLHSYLVDVVADDTPFCVKDEFLTVSHHGLHLAGLDKLSDPCNQAKREAGSC